MIGFVVENRDGYFNVIVQDESTKEWFLWDEGITNKEDATIIPESDGITILRQHHIPIEEWMRSTNALDLE